MQEKTAIRNNIATRLKQAREQAGYPSAMDFCEKNQLLPMQYIACEEGKTMINASSAIKYCKLLNISLRQLFIGP